MKRIAELDGLRAAAILMVVAWHYLGTGDPQTWPIFIVGRTGVDLFFVLSGYLITGILLANRDSPNYFSALYGRRSFRILPIYFVMVAIYLVGRKLGGSAPMLFDGPLPWWTYVVGLQNVWMTIYQNYGAAWLGATWSLAIEEQFYLVFPLVVYLTPPRLLPRLLIAPVSLRAHLRLRAGGSLWLLRTDAATGRHPRHRRIDRMAGVFRSALRDRLSKFSVAVLGSNLLPSGVRVGDRKLELQHGHVGS
jgi:peptidoglycan/LPS O-acetylase OafA/YrhL